MHVVFLFYLVPSSRRLLSTTARRLKGEESRRVPDLSTLFSVTRKRTDQTPSLDASTVQLILCSADEHVHVYIALWGSVNVKTVGIQGTRNSD